MITRGQSEIYDILTHLTFLNIEAQKLYPKIYTDSNHFTPQWNRVLENLENDETLTPIDLELALWG